MNRLDICMEDLDPSEEALAFFLFLFAILVNGFSFRFGSVVWMGEQLWNEAMRPTSALGL